MDQIVSGEEEEELGVDIEEGVGFNDTQEDVLDQVWSGRSSYDHRSEQITDDEDQDGLMIKDGKRRERSSQSLDLSDRKFDSVKVKKTRKPSKPPRPPKGPLLTANDQKLMREIAELAMRKRARIERMRRMKAAKSSSPCSSILAMIVTVIFFVFLIFQATAHFSSFLF
ncbi:Transmembrane protein [Hirschfeldia incana]|nr:Transmembrane protein [Hirschfeldia incana]KAJ0265116.1 Transmembrane protein [Hirschfeldia incana]